MNPSVLGLLLPDLSRPALKVAAGLGLAIVLAVAFVISSLGAIFGRITPDGLMPTAAPDAIPQDQQAVMESAADMCGLPWPVLAAVARVESDFGRNMATSSAGAIGYGQFLPSTWAAYGRGNPYDFHDALPAMARYLCANGGAADLRSALFAYNHAGWYVDETLAVAIHYGYAPVGSKPSQVLDLAKAQIGRPYVWGGTSPFNGFDCSGLVQWVYEHAGITLPRTAQQQFDATVRVSQDQLQPGDLVFFQFTYPSLDRITHVGIYVGNGLMLNAPAEGDVVRQMPLASPYWAAHFAGGGRVRGLS